MQPPSQDPTNPTGQHSSSPHSEQPSAPLPPNAISPTGQRYQPSPYPQTGPQFAPPPPQGSYPPGEEAYYNRISQDGGPTTQYHAGTQGKINVPPVPPIPPKQRNGWKVFSLVLLVLVLILGATTVLELRHTNSSPVVAVPTIPQPTSTSPAPTVATSAPAPSPASTPQTSAPVASGTITENLLLTCGANCNDPIHVTITTIQVDDGNGNMVWNISLKNVSGSSMAYGIDTFELLASSSQTQIPATFSQSSGTLTNSDPVNVQGTFAFVPIQNTTYTLTVLVEENPFMGPRITFDPAQITNL